MLAHMRAQPRFSMLDDAPRLSATWPAEPEGARRRQLPTRRDRRPEQNNYSVRLGEGRLVGKAAQNGGYMRGCFGFPKLRLKHD
jgi:hypothetical protein